MLATTGTPVNPTPSGYDDSVLESLDNPHLFLGSLLRCKLAENDALLASSGGVEAQPSSGLYVFTSCATSRALMPGAS